MDCLRIKVIILGDSGVGKSSLVYTFIAGEFTGNVEKTTAASFMSKQVKFAGQSVRLDLWDTAGHEKNAILGRLYWRDAKVVVLTFDVMRPETIEKMLKWYEVIKNELDVAAVKFFIAACKIDLLENEFEVSKSLNDFSVAIHAPIFKVSAKTFSSIEKLFTAVAKAGLEANTQSASRSSITLTKERHLQTVSSVKSVTRSKCC